MLSRRSLVALPLAFAAALALTGAAQAFTVAPYEAKAVDKAIRSGKPVVVHVYAPWCLQCRAQASILKKLSAEGRYGDIAFFEIHYDKQKDVVEALGLPRSTFLAFRGGKEVARMSWGTSEAAVVAVLDKVG